MLRAHTVLADAPARDTSIDVGCDQACGDARRHRHHVMSMVNGSSMIWRLFTAFVIAWQPIVFVAVRAGMMYAIFDAFSIGPNISTLESALWSGLGFLLMESPIVGLGIALWFVSRLR